MVALLLVHPQSKDWVGGSAMCRVSAVPSGLHLGCRVVWGWFVFLRRRKRMEFLQL